jgi:hypothetical protein
MHDMSAARRTSRLQVGTQSGRFQRVRNHIIRLLNPTDAATANTMAVWLVAAIALGIAGGQFLENWNNPETLWHDPYHDRNTHLSRGIDTALALRDLDPVGVLTAATREVTWPPLHPLLLGVIMAATRVDARLGVIPGLLGWAATVVCVWCIARRAAPDAGWFAGAVGVIFTVASPGFRLLGADVMLEGAGAGLSAFTLLAFIRCDRTGLAWHRMTCVALTCLFVEKFNYWLLLVAALTICLVFDGQVRTLANAFRMAGGPAMIRRLFGHKMGLAGLGLVAVSLVLTVCGPDTIAVSGRSFLLRPPGHILALGWGLLLLRAVFVWCDNRARIAEALSPAARIVFGWHILPCALWFLVPQSLLTFLWFVGPTHHGASEKYAPAQALLYQWQGFAGGFHTAPWSAVLCLVLAGPGLVYLFWNRSGLRAVAVFAVLSAAAVVLHPQQQWRFQATSLFALWVCAGVGATLPWRLFRAVSPPVRTIAAAVVLAALAGAHVVAGPALLADAVAVRRPNAPSDLALAEAWRPVANAGGVGFVTTFGVSDLFAWTVHERCQCRVPVEQLFVQMAPSRAKVARIAADWLLGTAAERVVFVDMPAPYRLPGLDGGRERLLGAADALESQTRFIREGTEPIRVGDALITVWRLAPDAAPVSSGPVPRKIFGILSASIALTIVIRLLWAKLAELSGCCRPTPKPSLHTPPPQPHRTVPDTAVPHPDTATPAAHSAPRHSC